MTSVHEIDQLSYAHFVFSASEKAHQNLETISIMAL